MRDQQEEQQEIMHVKKLLALTMLLHCVSIDQQYVDAIQMIK